MSRPRWSSRGSLPAQATPQLYGPALLAHARFSASAPCRHEAALHAAPPCACASPPRHAGSCSPPGLQAPPPLFAFFTLRALFLLFFSACISPHNANWPPNPLKASPISTFHPLGSPGTHLHPNVPSEALQRPPFALSAPFSTLRPSGPPHLVLLAPQNPPLAFKVPLKTPHLAPWPPQYHLGPLCRH